MFLEVKMMVWKRYRRHDGTQDLDTSEHRRRDLWREPSHEFESAMRWFRISSMISFGILGHCGVLETTGTVAASVAAEIGRRPSFDGFEPTRKVPTWRRQKPCLPKTLGSCSINIYTSRRSIGLDFRALLVFNRCNPSGDRFLLIN